MKKSSRYLISSLFIAAFIATPTALTALTSEQEQYARDLKRWEEGGRVGPAPTKPTTTNPALPNRDVPRTTTPLDGIRSKPKPTDMNMSTSSLYGDTKILAAVESNLDSTTKPRDDNLRNRDLRDDNLRNRDFRDDNLRNRDLRDRDDVMQCPYRDMRLSSSYYDDDGTYYYGDPYYYY